MYNITLIGTYHKAKGVCNLTELYKIIEKINPEVIFEEIAPSSLDTYHEDKNKSKLETDTIILYRKNHQIEHIPIDYDYVQPDSFFSADRYMHGRVEKISYGYRKLVDVISLCTEKCGFKYLNSTDAMNLYMALDNEIEETLQMLNDERLFEIRKSWNDITEKRENIMIQNIFDYSKEHKYNKGLFLIGAAHRGSIINKVQKCVETEDVKLNWNYCNYDNIL
jgi:hypothetical protein